MELKVWHNGTLKTVDQMHADQSPIEVYWDACDRLANEGSPAKKERLHRRWPTLGDANRAMTDAYAGLTDDQKADDLARIDDELNWINITMGLTGK